MDDHLELILQQVADGRLTPAEAEPMIAQATGQSPPQPGTDDGVGERDTTPAMASDRRSDAQPRRAVRLQVTERGRAVVDLRIPMNLASLAGSVVPGLASAHVERIRDAIRAGEVGPILEIQDEEGDGVVISTE